MESVAEVSPQGMREPPFFQVGLAKLALMSTFTLGFYDFFWSYKQWDSVRHRTAEDFNPWLRTIAAMPLFFFPLFRDISRTVAARSSVRLRFPTLLAASFAVLTFMIFIPTWINLLSLLAVVPLVVVQSRINACHADLGFDSRVNTRLTPLNLLGVTCGVVGYGIWLWPWIRWFVAKHFAV